MWFRTDLRIEDNPALAAAMQQGSVIAFFFVTRESWDEHAVSPARLSLLIRQVHSLATRLQELGVPLIIRDCAHFSEIPGTIGKLCKKYAVTQLFFNHEYEINERQCTRHVTEQLQKNGVKISATHDQCAIQPGRIRKQDGDWYKVFTAFKRRYLAELNTLARPEVRKPRKQPSLDVRSDLRDLEKLTIPDGSHESLWPEGEKEAARRLKNFANSALSNYHLNRDLPAVSGTSTLSPYLSIGAISVTQCMRTAMRLGNIMDSSESGPATWVNELIWRDFYRHLMFAYPEICKFKAFKPETDNLPWRHDKKLFRCWTSAQTGYPIVDAAMEQLRQTGWMHNRLRMVTAMFLTKHLFVDWRWGENYFMRNLVDGDLASNNGGWQWSASTGVDAAPYFRIFNPVRQSERFDSEGAFIRQYLPKLKSLNNRSIHMPTPVEAQALGYYQPIVIHKEAVNQTKKWFKESL